MYYDIETLTREKIDSELTRLHKEIEALESRLIYLEEIDPKNPEILDFYEEGCRIRDQLDIVYRFLSHVDQERGDDYRRNNSLVRMYGKLPDWRVEQLKRKKSYLYYHFRYK